MGLLGQIFSGQTRVQLIQNNNTVVQFDASIKEQHKRESPPTEFPVENGQTISDQIILKPFALELTGLITDTPIGGVEQLLTEVATTLTAKLTPPKTLVAAGAAIGLGTALFTAIAGSKSPSVAAYGQLLILQEKGLPVDVITSLYRYPNMWIKSISAPRDADTGKALLFTIELVQLILVSPQSVNIAIFANPALSAAIADMGEQGTGIPNGFQQGFSDTNKAINAVVPGGLAH